MLGYIGHLLAPSVPCTCQVSTLFTARTFDTASKDLSDKSIRNEDQNAAGYYYLVVVLFEEVASYSKVITPTFLLLVQGKCYQRSDPRAYFA